MVKWILIRRLVPLTALAILACSPSPGKVEKENIVATVNGAPIRAAELERKAADYGNNNRVTSYTIDDQFQLMIEHKLLIQEAVKMGISKDKKFAETIKAFWEQTIIRNLMEAKNAELSGKIFVTEEEIANEYERMKFRLRIRAVRGVRTKQDADAIVLQMKSGKGITGEEIIGPVFYEDVKGSPLARAFDMKEGQIEALPVDNEQIVMCVTGREAVPLPPLKELNKQIRESILVQKRQKALEEWIAAVKKAAKIQIDEKEMRRIAHE